MHQVESLGSLDHTKLTREQIARMTARVDIKRVRRCMEDFWDIDAYRYYFRRVGLAVNLLTGLGEPDIARTLALCAGALVLEFGFCRWQSRIINSVKPEVADLRSRLLGSEQMVKV